MLFIRKVYYKEYKLQSNHFYSSKTKSHAHKTQEDRIHLKEKQQTRNIHSLKTCPLFYLFHTMHAYIENLQHSTSLLNYICTNLTFTSFQTQQLQ